MHAHTVLNVLSSFRMRRAGLVWRKRAEVHEVGVCVCVWVLSAERLKSSCVWVVFPVRRECMGGKSLKWMGFEETFLISEMSEAEIVGFLRGHTTPPHMCEGSTAAAIAVRARSCEYDRDDDSPAVCVCFFFQGA